MDSAQLASSRTRRRGGQTALDCVESGIGAAARQACVLWGCQGQAQSTAGTEAGRDGGRQGRRLPTLRRAVLRAILRSSSFMPLEWTHAAGLIEFPDQTLQLGARTRSSPATSCTAEGHPTVGCRCPAADAASGWRPMRLTTLWTSGKECMPWQLTCGRGTQTNTPTGSCRARRARRRRRVSSVSNGSRASGGVEGR